jgi:hypothetical protein
MRTTEERTCEQGCNGCDECIDDDDAPECEHCCGKGWNWEWMAISGHYEGGESVRVDCDRCEGAGR